MTELETALAENRAAVEEFVAAGRALDAARWRAPVGEGKWTPAQIAEHLAIIYEYNRKVMVGTAPGVPWLLRPILQPLLRKRNDLLASDPVEVRVFETCLNGLDNLPIRRPVHHALEVGCATRSRHACAVAERTAATDRWCRRCHQVV